MTTVRILAGRKRSGEPVVEEVPAPPRDGGTFELTGSPASLRGSRLVT